MNKNLPIDIVIPTHQKDLPILEHCIAAARRKIVNVRRIIVISKECYTKNAEWFDEAAFPFSIELVKNHVGGHAGWYFQQLLKLYAPLVIPDISENVMILDSDTVFFRRVRMLDRDGLPFYNISKDANVRDRPFDQRVAKHTQNMLPQLAIENLPAEFQQVSGISHNMVFNREILRDLFAKVEAHDANHDPFYKIFLKHADQGHSASEYQIYFNFLLVFHPQKFHIRKLRYKNTADVNITKYRFRFKYYYCAFHSYLRDSADVKKENLLTRIFTKLTNFL